MPMTQQEADALYEQGKDAVTGWMLAMDQRVRAQEHRLQALEARLAQNSNNSSKPPSTDPPERKMAPMSLRKKTGRKPGGQKGHEGNTLRQVDEPDEILEHRPAHCPHCCTDLSEAPQTGYSRRQVVEMPEPRVLVTEHRAMCVACPCCGKQATGAFPEGVDQPAQYGPNLLGFGIYLHAQHLIPYARAAKIVQDLTQAPLSAGSLHRAMQQAYATLADFEGQVKAALAAAPLKHVDETSGRVAGKRHWFHTRCTHKLTHLFVHEKRGKEAVADLLDYSGRLVSDFFSNYVSLACLHQFCIAHLCRELQGIFEQSGALWASELKQFFESCNAACHRARDRGSPRLWNARRLAGEFDALVASGLSVTPGAASKGAKRSKARCLLERLRDYREDCLAFLFDLSLPFTNNEAERDLRMLKVKGKISGCFRSLEGAHLFCRVRGYLQSCRKQAMDLLACLRSVFAGDPLLPSFQHG